MTSYRNGYISIRTDNLVADKRYDVSFKITEIVSNPLNSSLSDIVIILPNGNQYSGLITTDNTLIFRNCLYSGTENQ